ncbi:MAG: hemolysin III family protein [Acidimicrobiia bacterium]|nr:hemolysin III family protein [Acidimicrobiia bacterium]MBT8217025.1 hemolysin III family protein [Acidimicrobiia bacterium]NNF09923.1 hemolysin III family protein [Acidimicrobiia bacterium]
MTDRIRLGKMTNPVRGFMHGSAAVISAAGMALLVARSAPDGVRVFSMTVFGISLIGLYTASALYHSVPWRAAWKKRMQRLDHSMIFVLVAGTYTPIAVNVLTGPWRTVTLSVVWGAAAIGIIQKIAFPRIPDWVSIALQTTMGWFAIVPFLELVEALSNGAIALMVAGGLSYTIGLVLLATERPQLFPRIFSHHEVFHVLVVLGSLFHFLMILWYVVPHDRL